MMNIGVATEETWSFLHEIYDDLKVRHRTSLFQRRVTSLPAFNVRANRWLLQRDLAQFMRSNDVVFFEWASELLAVASRLPKRCGIVARLHRYELYQWADKINWDAVDTLILVSQAKRREFLGRFPGQEAKIVVIPEAISLARFPYRPQPWRGQIGTLCHLKPRKRVYELVLAFHELAQARSDLHLHLGGGRAVNFDEYYLALLNLVDKLKLHDRVTLHGAVSQPESWYPQIDLFVANGYSEGLQVAPMEAMASGCYTLSHFWDGAEELLPRQQLYYSDRELRQRILEYADSSDQQRSQRQAALRQIVADNFDVAKTKIQIRQLIEAAGTVQLPPHGRSP
jgi:glycosyltransferase involved in cell wall biosynthesis